MSDLSQILSLLTKMDERISKLEGGSPPTSTPVVTPPKVTQPKKAIQTYEDRAAALYKVAESGGELMLNEGELKPRPSIFGRDEPELRVASDLTEVILNTPFDSNKLPPVPADDLLASVPMTSNKKRLREFNQKAEIIRKLYADPKLTDKQCKYILSLPGGHIEYINAFVDKAKETNYLVNSIGTDEVARRKTEITRELGRLQGMHDTLKKDFEAKRAPILARMEELKAEQAALNGSTYSVTNKYAELQQFTTAPDTRVNFSKLVDVVAAGKSKTEAAAELSQADIKRAGAIRRRAETSTRTARVDAATEYVRSLNALLPGVRQAKRSHTSVERMEEQYDDLANKRKKFGDVSDISKSVADRFSLSKETGKSKSVTAGSKFSVPITITEEASTSESEAMEDVLTSQSSLAGAFGDFGLTSPERPGEGSTTTSSSQPPPKRTKTTEEVPQFEDKRYEYKKTQQGILAVTVKATPAMKKVFDEIEIGKNYTINLDTSFSAILPKDWPARPSGYRGDGKSALRAFGHFCEELGGIDRLYSTLWAIGWEGQVGGEDELNAFISIGVSAMQAK